MKVFVDSDVIISSLISNSGAASELINNHPEVIKIISDFSQKELEIVKSRLKIVKATPPLDLIKIIGVKNYSIYSTDPNDAHIVTGADQAQVKFLITYNLKHYKIDKIKRELNIIVMTPGMFLQYLRLSDKID